jgi:hypothetical protein
VAKKLQPLTPAAQLAVPQRPALGSVSQFMEREREVEIEYWPLMLEALQSKVNAVADSVRDQTPDCSQCGQHMKRHDSETVFSLARFGKLHAAVTRYRCRGCKRKQRPLLDLLGVEPGRIRGSLAHVYQRCWPWSRRILWRRN